MRSYEMPNISNAERERRLAERERILAERDAKIAEEQSQKDDLIEFGEILAESSADTSKPIKKPYKGEFTSINKPLVDVAYDSEVWLFRIAKEMKRIRKILTKEKQAS
jgi:hypothetical protein